ncbi:protocadherin gamma-B6 [Octopus sinensis]|uniref:Protocadherin gamma-B6 n=1 Tax=Octopus sinensis TaxID=2607531 RepID=A0A7E6FCQ9_9MOLL|nr:protocadherin gamma-B6 [Octopus sinensis]
MLVPILLLLFLPKLSQTVDITYNVKENQAPGTYIGDIAIDSHLGSSIPSQDHSLLWFSQLTSSSQLFNVSKTGKFYTSLILDAESLCKYKTECFRIVDVAVSHKESFVKILEIKVIIEDANDNQPKFPEKQVEIMFSERDSIGSWTAIPNAMDNDVSIQSSRITYHLKKTKQEPFTLSVFRNLDGSAKLGIVLQEKLDRELKDSYQLQVIAKDGGHPPKEGVLNLQILIRDENDNSPIFSQNIYNVSIKNSYQRSMPIVTLSATDLDSGENGKVMFQFSSKTSESARAYFKLNESTGEIWQLQKFPPGSKKLYKLYVKAKDGGNPSLSSVAMVLVNINSQENNPPDIDMNFISKSAAHLASISEGVKIGSFIAYVKVTDNDIGQNGEVHCLLHHDKLQLQGLGRNKYKVIVKKVIDRESKSYINFTISCEDKGFPPLKTDKHFYIQVMDINDVQPEFIKSLFRFQTYENEEANFPVGFINASDPDLGSGGELKYSLLNNNEDILPFKISNFGFISTISTLDHEKQDVYKFKVLVEDKGIPSLSDTANIIVEVMDKNDNVPYFTFPSVDPFNLDVHYHPQSNTEITTLRASDRDSHVNAFLRYEIFGGNNRQLFSVNPYSGVISFSRPIYQNDAGSYTLNLVVKDSGTPVLSATTTLSLTLTVSNTTARMYTAEDTESDNRIHINLMIIIVVAAVIVSVAIVVSVIVCVVHKRHQRDVQYATNNEFVGEQRQSGYVCELMSPKYDIPVAMVTDADCNRTPKATLIRRDPNSDYEPGCDWEVSSAEVHPQFLTTQSHQINFLSSRASDIGQHEPIIVSLDRLNDISTIPSNAENNQEWNERNAGHYETLPGLKYFPQEQTPSSEALVTLTTTTFT